MTASMSPLARALMIRNEGVRTKAYLDTAKPPRPTIGIGRIKGVKMGDTCTVDQALAWFAEEWDTYYAYVKSHVRPDTAERELIAMASLAYNVGTEGFGGSTLRRRHNERAAPEAIRAAFLMWNMAGGKVQQGLINRREREFAVYAGLEWDQPRGSTNVSVLTQVEAVLPLLVQQAQTAKTVDGKPLSNTDKAGQVVEAVIEAIPAAAPFHFLIHMMVTALVNLWKKHHPDFVPTENATTQEPIGDGPQAQAAKAAVSP